MPISESLKARLSLAIIAPTFLPFLINFVSDHSASRRAAPVKATALPTAQDRREWAANGKAWVKSDYKEGYQEYQKIIPYLDQVGPTLIFDGVPLTK